MRTLAKDVGLNPGREVEVMGWAHRIRDLGKVVFVVLRDRSGMVQIVLDSAPDFTHESVIKVTGTVQPNEKAPGGHEIAAKKLEVLAKADPALPLPVNGNLDQVALDSILDNRVNGNLDQVALDSILDNRQIALRNPKILNIFRLQSAIVQYFCEQLRSEGFTEIKTSKLIGTGTEGGTGLFEVEYFEKKAYLAQSPQFFKQAMVASGLERVFEVACAYRAEKHDTPRHLNEYVSMDVEMAFIDSEKELIELEKRIFSHVFGEIAKNDATLLEPFGARVPTQAEIDNAPTITYEEALAIVAKSGKRIYEVNPEAERMVCDWSMKEHGSDIVFINQFPRKARPFYAYPDGHNTLSFDCIFRGLEITTGGRRLNEYQAILDNLPKFGMTPEPIADYLSNFKFGCPPHGGFAIGLERITQKILGLTNVKEASLFPRDRKRLCP
jgi:nondiscriminating aspartyl-tRNA synthetase